MFYKVSFTIDNGCRYDQHIAVVSADSRTEAFYKVSKYVESKLGYDESMQYIGIVPIEKDDILYCDYKEET